MGRREQPGLAESGKCFLYPGIDLYMENTGYDMMLWLAGLDGIPKELFEAAKVDGAGSCRAFSILLCRG
mgnify:CR=1 FL=1